MQTTTIAIVADDQSVRQTMRSTLSSSGFAVLDVDSAMQTGSLDDADAVCLAVTNEAGLQTLRRIQELDELLPIVVVTRDEAVAERALEDGAYDWVSLSSESKRLGRTVGHAVEKRALTLKVAELRAQLPEQEESGDSDEVVPLRDLERQAIARALRATKGSVTKAAKLLGIGRATLYRRLASPEMASLRPRRNNFATGTHTTSVSSMNG